MNDSSQDRAKASDFGRRPDGAAPSRSDGTARVSIPTEPEVLAAIADVARQHLGWTGDVAAGQSIVEAIALDSLRQITLLVEIEDRFRIRLDQDDDRAIRTVGDLVAVVRRKCAADAGHAGARHDDPRTL
jgi:acyl carrier protein